ncbi:hypothetical protein PITC_038530 [Penicillium italicum]|uniref:Uncharacterized protein n=1 Tax=Penicillium italicum TaxID=40296 RepID=A0A0A2KJ37_PENIT|nr:hypothetical protein PITC_038530 [Penicillium italicum]
MSEPIGPVFLHSCAAYRRYLQKGAAGELSLPPYEETMDGEIIVRYGEVYCRIPGCEHQRIPLSNTRSLRTHLRSHGGTVARYPPGRISQGAQDMAIAWFQALFPEMEPRDENGGQRNEDEN